MTKHNYKCRCYKIGDNRSVRFTETNQELGSLGSCLVRGAEPKFRKLGRSYVVTVQFANIFIKFLSN